jgi:hypothetical protein
MRNPIRSARPWPVALSLGWILACAGCDPGPGQQPAEPRKDAPPASAESTWFHDITGTSGLNFVQRAGTNYAMADILGSGLALLDYDQDGRTDVYCVQNAHPPHTGRNQLFHQEADGTFRDVSGGSGADLSGPGMGAIAGDVNNDGRPELLVTE